MACCELKAYTVSDINFFNRLDPNIQIKIGNKFSYNVKYPKGNSDNICRGELDVEIGDTSNEKKLNIRVVAVGIFSYSAGATKEMIHTESFKILFPYVRALITTITANAGIKPIIIPNIDIDNQSICRYEGNQN